MLRTRVKNIIEEQESTTDLDLSETSIAKVEQRKVSINRDEKAVFAVYRRRNIMPEKKWAKPAGEKMCYA